MSFGYDIESHFPTIADGRAQFRTVSEDGGYTTHHQKMITPFIISNRSVFVTTYHVHSDTIDGQYTLVRSSKGNDSISDREAEAVGDDVEADFILFWINCIPIDENSMKVQFIFHLNLGGTIPQMLREKISAKQAGFIDMIANHFKSHGTQIEQSWTKCEAKINAEI